VLTKRQTRAGVFEEMPSLSLYFDPRRSCNSNVRLAESENEITMGNEFLASRSVQMHNPTFAPCRLLIVKANFSTNGSSSRLSSLLYV
jgi:hypothetical protein